MTKSRLRESRRNLAQKVLHWMGAAAEALAQVEILQSKVAGLEKVVDELMDVAGSRGEELQRLRGNEKLLLLSIRDTARERGIKEGLADQIDRLARFIVTTIPGEPSRSEGAVDTAIRLLRRMHASIELFKACDTTLDRLIKAEETIEELRTLFRECVEEPLTAALAGHPECDDADVSVEDRAVACINRLGAENQKLRQELAKYQTGYALLSKEKTELLERCIALTERLTAKPSSGFPHNGTCILEGTWANTNWEVHLDFIAGYLTGLKFKQTPGN